MTALAAVSSVAYRAQQIALVSACGYVQRVARRVLMREREVFSPEQLADLRRRHRALIARDVANVEAGIYPRALLFQIPFADYARRLPRLAWDVPAMLQRRARGGWRELPRDIDLSRYPPYYRRTFHWQTDGYLSQHSAELYDLGVEFLFGGTADVMRRQALVPLIELAGRDNRPLRILDVGCGTGRTLAQLRRACPRAQLTGVDLSPYYLEVARRETASSPGVELVAANAESLPLPDASFDAVVSVFLFHELPRAARRRVWSEVRRVLKPGGSFVVLDSIQRADARAISYFVDRFAEDMHEPFYRDYLDDDLAAGLEASGFRVSTVSEAYLAKVVTARVPEVASKE